MKMMSLGGICQALDEGSWDLGRILGLINVSLGWGIRSLDRYMDAK